MKTVGSSSVHKRPIDHNKSIHSYRVGIMSLTKSSMIVTSVNWNPIVTPDRSSLLSFRFRNASSLILACTCNMEWINIILYVVVFMLVLPRAVAYPLVCNILLITCSNELGVIGQPCCYIVVCKSYPLKMAVVQVAPTLKGNWVL